MSSNLRENTNFSFYGHFENDIIFTRKKNNDTKLVNVCNKMKNKIHTVPKSNRKSDETEKICTPNAQIHVRENL